MNLEEINRIEDSGERNIRQEYWALRHKAFLNEHEISDIEIGNVHKRLIAQEERAVREYWNTKQSISLLG